MIRKLIVAMVAAAMLVAVAAPAYAQNAPQLVPNGAGDEELNLALANLEQECGIEQENENNQEQITTVVQNNEQNQTGVDQSGAKGLLVLNTGDVNQNQSAENNAVVVPIQKNEQANVNTGDVECDAAIVQLQDVLALFLFGGLERDGEPEPNGA
ncbi:MAG: hypothetical protein M3M97_06305 [Actinomycetota bacterium]|nr:hypothetical protein [Actinomycetota bacterium]